MYPAEMPAAQVRKSWLRAQKQGVQISGWPQRSCGEVREVQWASRSRVIDLSMRLATPLPVYLSIRLSACVFLEKIRPFSSLAPV